MRGTQSFVGVMAEVFRRPSLTGLEVLWRWVFWAAVLAKPARSLFSAVMGTVTAFQVGGFPALGDLLASYPASARASGPWWPRLLVLPLWLLAAAVGRGLVLRRATGGWKPRLAAMLVLAALRWTTWALVIALWCAGLRWALGALVVGPRGRGAEPAWVPFCAVLISGTLAMFVVWLGTAWVFPLLEIYAADGQPLLDSCRRAFRRGALRSKLAEINLVMGIVKIALIVLAMVFSASPLPFQSVETQEFLVTWTAGVLLLYCLASDYFHVVRLVAFLRMTEAFGDVAAAAPQGGPAS